MTEIVAPSPAKRARKPNFTLAECAVMFEEAGENINIIKGKFTSTLTNKNKTRVWDEIANKENALGICKRSVIEVKDKWRAMVSSPKKEHNKCASSRKKTWEGRKPESPMGTTVKKIKLFEKHPSFSGIFGGIDSRREPRENVMELCM